MLSIQLPFCPNFLVIKFYKTQYHYYASIVWASIMHVLFTYITLHYEHIYTNIVYAYYSNVLYQSFINHKNILFFKFFNLILFTK